jgi:HTH-type transcriptional regulator, sugar sensing transcriptional regulator
MYEEFLEGTGLTKNEARVYLTLLKIGKAKSYAIVKDSGISSGKIYETLSKLSNKGLIKSVIENGVKHFIANKPESLFDYLKQKELELHDKEQHLEKILPQLQNLRRIDENPEEVSLVKGFRGILPIVYSALEKGTEVKVMGVRSSKDVQFNNFWKNWHRRRIELKKNAQMLFSDKDTEYWKFFKKQKYTEVRETLSFSPSAVMIIDNECFLFSYEEEFTCIHIISKSIAKSFTGFFDGLWKMAGK